MAKYTAYVVETKEDGKMGVYPNKLAAQAHVSRYNQAYGPSEAHVVTYSCETLAELEDIVEDELHETA